MPSVDASILIVSYNTQALTLACLSSIAAHTRDLVFDVIVIDNASSDGSADAIAAAYPDVRLIRLGENRGFAGGVAAGLAASTAEFVILFNSDAYLTGNAFAPMVAFARAHNDAGGVGCRVTNDDRTHQPTAARFPHLWLDFSDHVLRPLGLVPRSWQANCVDATDYRDAVTTDWISGSCALYRRKAIDGAGGIDTDFFLGEEDIDLGWRLKSRGWRVYYAPIDGVVHLGGRSRAMSAASAGYFFSGRFLFYKKHYSAAYARTFKAVLDVAYGLRWLIASARVALGGGATAKRNACARDQPA